MIRRKNKQETIVIVAPIESPDEVSLLENVCKVLIPRAGTVPQIYHLDLLDMQISLCPLRKQTSNVFTHSCP